MTRKFKTVDYEAALDQTVSLREALPANHLARFVVELVAQLDLTQHLRALWLTRRRSLCAGGFAGAVVLRLRHRRV